MLALNSAAVRNVLLAVTNQPLVPSLPSVRRQLSPASVEPDKDASLSEFPSKPTLASTSTSTASFRRQPAAGRPATPEIAAEQHRRRGRGGDVSSRCKADDSKTDIGSGVLEAVGRVYRRSSAAVASAVLGSPPPAPVDVAGGREEGDLQSHRRASRRESGRTVEKGRSRREQGVGLVVGGASTTNGEEEEDSDRRARRSRSRQRSLHGDASVGGDAVPDVHGSNLVRADGPTQNCSLQDTTRSGGGSVSARWSRDVTRRRGVEEVYGVLGTDNTVKHYHFQLEPAPLPVKVLRKKD